MCCLNREWLPGYTHCYVMWYRLTTGNVAPQCLPSKDLVLMSCYFILLKLASLIAVKPFYQKTKLITMNLLTLSYAVHFDINKLSNLTELVQEIGLMCMMPRACLHYTRYYLTPDICNLTKPLLWRNWYHFPPKSTQSCDNTQLIIILITVSTESYVFLSFESTLLYFVMDKNILSYSSWCLPGL